MGDTESNWEGVQWDNTALLASPNVYPLTGVSATSTNFVAKTTANYGSDTFFFGQIDYSTSDAYVYVIR